MARKTEKRRGRASKPKTDRSRVGSDPPAALNVCEYDAFTVAPGNSEVLMVSPDATVIESC